MNTLMLFSLAVMLAASEEHHMPRFQICVDTRWGFIDQHGKVVIPPRFAGVQDFSEGLAPVKVDTPDGQTESGFINPAGEFVIGPGVPPNFTWPERYKWSERYRYDQFHEGRAIFWIGDIYGHRGFIDKTGRLVIGVQYDNAFRFSGGITCVEYQKRHYIIDRDGNRLSRVPAGLRGSVVSAGRCSVWFSGDDGRSWSGLMDQKGNIITQPQYTLISGFFDGLALAWKRTSPTSVKYGFLALDGTVHLPLEFDQASHFHDGNAVVAKDGRNIIIDRDGRVLRVLPFDPRTFDISAFHEGLAAMKRSDMEPHQSGFINRDGQIVIPLIYDEVGMFRDGLAFVSKGTRVAYIDRTGKEVWSIAVWNPGY